MKFNPFLRRGLLPALLVQTTVLAGAGSAHAALVTWGAPTNITPGLAGDLDVSTAGSLVGAFNLHGATTPVNGVTFTGLELTPATSVTSGNFTFASTPFSFNGGGSSPGSGPFSTLSAPYQALLAGYNGVGSFTTTPAFTLTISGLITGQTYQFQWWDNVSGGAISNTTATAGNAVSLNPNTTAAVGGLGQYAIGTFVADATTTQSIAFSSSGTNVTVNGLQLRQLAPAPAVPEPGTALAGVALLGLCGMRRRR